MCRLNCLPWSLDLAGNTYSTKFSCAERYRHPTSEDDLYIRLKENALIPNLFESVSGIKTMY